VFAVLLLYFSLSFNRVFLYAYAALWRNKARMNEMHGGSNEKTELGVIKLLQLEYFVHCRTIGSRRLNGFSVIFSRLLKMKLVSLFLMY